MSDIKSSLSNLFEQWSRHNSSSLRRSFSVLCDSVACSVAHDCGCDRGAFHKETLQNRIVGQVSALMGPPGASAFREMLGHTKSLEANSAAIVIGLFVLLVSASGVFSELRTALNIIWDVKPKQSGWREIVKDKFFSFAMVLGIGLLLLVSLVASTALAGFSKVIGARPPGPFADGLNVIVSIVVITLLFAVIYRVVPEETLPWRRLWPGSFATAVLFTGCKFLLALYLTRAGVGSVYGAAGSLVVLLVWLYYSALIFLFGAEFTRVYACDREAVCPNIKSPDSAPAERDKNLFPWLASGVIHKYRYIRASSSSDRDEGDR